MENLLVSSTVFYQVVPEVINHICPNISDKSVLSLLKVKNKA